MYADHGTGGDRAQRMGVGVVAILHLGETGSASIQSLFSFLPLRSETRLMSGQKAPQGMAEKQLGW